jgi:hypothetical protein
MCSSSISLACWSAALARPPAAAQPPPAAQGSWRAGCWLLVASPRDLFSGNNTTSYVTIDQYLSSIEDVPLGFLREAFKSNVSDVGDNKFDNTNPKQEIFTMGKGVLTRCFCSYTT